MNKIETKNKYGENLETMIEGAPISEAKRILIMVHGFGTSLHERGVFDDIVARITQTLPHFCLVRFSWSGFGESEGKQEDTTLMKVSDDFRSVLDFVYKNKRDSAAVLVLGYSMGNIVTTNVLASGDYKIEKAITVNPTNYSSGAEAIKNWLVYPGVKIENDKILVIPRADGTITRINRAYWDTLDEINYHENLEKLITEVPTVMFRASDDKIVDNRELMKLPFSKVIEISGGHNFSGKANREQFITKLEAEIVCKSCKKE